MIALVCVCACAYCHVFLCLEAAGLVGEIYWIEPLELREVEPKMDVVQD